MFRFPHHRARLLPPPPSSSSRAPTTNCVRKGATRARSRSALLGGARPRCCSARRQPCVTWWGGERSGMGGMSLPGGSRHLDTRSSCGAHARPKCLTGCGYFLATRAFRAIVTRAATSREKGGQGESGRPLEPLSLLLLLLPSFRQGALTWLRYSAWTTVSVSRRCVCDTGLRL